MHVPINEIISGRQLVALFSDWCDMLFLKTVGTLFELTK